MTRALVPLLAAIFILPACSDKATGPAESDVALRSSSSNAPFGPLVLPATGTLADGGTFVGNIEIRRITLDEATGQFIITGLLQGKATPSGGTAKQVTQNFTTTAIIGDGGASAAANAVVVQQQELVCEVLNLDLGPLHLNVLGLVVDLAPVVLDITAVPGPGNLLGNLLCAVVSLLDFPALLGVISQLLDVINQILGGLGGA